MIFTQVNVSTTFVQVRKHPKEILGRYALTYIQYKPVGLRGRLRLKRGQFASNIHVRYTASTIESSELNYTDCSHSLVHPAAREITLSKSSPLHAILSTCGLRYGVHPHLPRSLDPVTRGITQNKFKTVRSLTFQNYIMINLMISIPHQILSG